MKKGTAGVMVCPHLKYQKKKEVRGNDLRLRREILYKKISVPLSKAE